MRVKEAFDDMLNGAGEGVIEVFGIEYTASLVLESVDPTAYRCAFAEWEPGDGEFTCDSCNEDMSGEHMSQLGIDDNICHSHAKEECPNDEENEA